MIEAPERGRLSWKASLPFFLVHLAPLGALWTGVRPRDIVLCVALYYVRMFFITAGYHRYFAHRSYKLGRFMQFLMAFGGATAAQKGPLWWAGHHRDHHRYSDTDRDIHSPKKGFWWAHVGWILVPDYDEVPLDRIKDFARFPELRWLDRFYLVPPTMLALAVFAYGGWSALFIGFFLSTVLLYHGTFLVNSLAHLWGRRRFATRDTSRNSFLVALLTCGEGWHNNHHHYQSSANQGFYWWEIDLSYYVLRLLSFVGLVRDLRRPTERALKHRRIRDGEFDIGMFHAYYEKAAARLATTRREAGAYCDARVKEVEEFMNRTLEAAEQLAREAGAGRPFAEEGGGGGPS